MVCVRHQRKIVLEKPKNVERPLKDLEEETSKLADRVTAALVNYDKHMGDHHEKLEFMSNKAWPKNQSNDTKRRYLQMTGTMWMHVLSGSRFTERR